MKTDLHAPDSAYIPGIDGLRAIAVMSVIVYHLRPDLLPGGFTGVDVFFVISGYVISRSLAANRPANLWNYLLQFYRRRVLRILPALLVMLCVSSVAASLFIPDVWLSSLNSRTAVTSFFGLSNFFLVHRADGYFSDRAEFNPFVHTWSLAVEEQFYLLFPLIFYWRVRSAADSRLRRASIWMLGAAAVASLLLARYQSSHAPLQAFFLLPSRFWELAAGALLFELQSRMAIAKQAVFPNADWLSLLGFTLLAAGFVVARETAFPYPRALLPVTGTLILIASTIGLLPTARVAKRVLTSVPVTYVGRLSYSLYLWHWPVFTLFRWTTGLGSVPQVTFAVLLTTALSMASYHGIEAVVRGNVFLRRRPAWQVVGTGAACTMVFAAAAGFLFWHRDAYGINLSVTKNSSDWNNDYLAASLATPILGTRAALPAAGRTLFVIGDSHASTYGIMATMATASLGARAVVLGSSGCPIARLFEPLTAANACNYFEDVVLPRLKKEARPGDIALLASLRVPHLMERSGSLDPRHVIALANSPEAAEQRRIALEQAEATIDALNALGLRVLLDAPKPVFRAPPFRCAGWFNRDNPVCRPGFQVPRELLMSLRAPTMDALKYLQRTSGIAIWDPFPWLCATEVCSAFDGDRPLFLDADHLSGYGNRRLVEPFVNELKLLWNIPSE